ncbi:uncharacterized protein zgc:174906 isoform X1 [Gadus morhua]|uniref:Type 1 death domain-containing protein n=2 Tax=Gadus morhua TaxID=8049 RepID=D7R9X2_GADMO|nr:uncharacterized protein LOC115542168 isoform X1 [Gadus morhua]ADG85726.1 type 1 death domain-containing protein [Gadus morhua]
MDKESETSNHQLLRCLKPELIEILSADPELLLQYAHSRKLVTENGYKKVRAQQISTEKVTTLLDLIYDGGRKASHGLLELLKEDTFQENFPRLSILVNPDPEEASKRTTEDSTQQSRSTNQPCMSVVSEIVTQKQLLKVAGAMSRTWKEVGIQVLDISSEKLDAIEAENNTQKMRAFRMLQTWRSRKRENATAAKLHDLLSHEDLGLDPEVLDSLLESS